MNILYTELVRILARSSPHRQQSLMVGLYGNGKTTTTAKLAEWYRKRAWRTGCGTESDVHRPGAYNQLTPDATREILVLRFMENLIIRMQRKWSRSVKTTLSSRSGNFIPC